MSDNKDVSYLVFESTMARFERTVSRLWVALIITIFLLVATNIAWISYEQQFEDVSITQDNTNGYNSYIGNDGDIINGTANN